MNAKARQLQANNTIAKNTSGLDAKGQVSSSYDLALIAREGLRMPAFKKYASTLRTKFPASGSMTKKKRKSFMVYNHNPLLLGQYPGAIGIKTGYTDAARRTFIGAAKHGDRTLIVTIMGYETNTYRTAEALLDWGFANQKKVVPVGQLVEPLPAVQATASAVAADAAAPARAEEVSAGGSSSSLPLWPFMLIAVGLLGVVVWSMLGNRSNDPLAAANRGLGGSHRPRGRGGPRRY